MTRAIALTLAVLAAAACEHMPRSPLAPSTLSLAPGPPLDPTTGVAAVSGIYRGPITMTITGAPGHGPMRDTGQLTATVTQDGSLVTLSADAEWTTGHQVVWRNVVGTIDSLGLWTGPRAEDFTDENCGRVTYRPRQITFAAGTMRYHGLAETARCGWYEFEATLTR